MTQFDSLGGMNVVFSADISAAMKAIDAFGATLSKVTDGVAAKLKVFDAGFDAMNKAVAASAKATSQSFDAFDARLKQLAQDSPSHVGKVRQSLESLGSTGAQKAEAGVRSFGTTVREVSESAAASLRRLGGSFEVLETIIAGAIAERGFEKFKELDRSLAELQGALELTSARFATVRSDVIAFASSINAPVQAVADSVRRFVQVQFTIPEALKLSEVALKGGRAAMVDTKTATDALVTTLRSFHIPAEEAARTMGQLVTAGEQSAGGFAEFATALTQVGPLANQFNFKLEDTLGILRLLTNQSGNVSEATVKFRAILQELATIDPYSKQGEKLREVLGTTIELALASEGPVEVFKKLIVAADGSSAALHELVGSGRAAAAFIRIAGEGVDKLDESVQKFRDVGVRTLDEAAARAKDTVSGLLTTSQKLVSNTIQLAFERNAEAIKSALKALNEFLIKNKEVVSQVVQAAFYFSVSVVAINAFRGAVILTAKALEFLGTGVTIVQSGLKLLAGVLTGEFGVALAGAIPKVAGLVASLRAVLTADIAVGVAETARSIYGLGATSGATAAQLKALATPGMAVPLSEMAGAALTAEQRIAGLAGAIGKFTLGLTAAVAVAAAFYAIGRRIGEALFGEADALTRTGDAWEKYHRQAGAVRNVARVDAETERLKAQQAKLDELVTLYGQLAKAKDATERAGIEDRIGKVRIEIDSGADQARDDATLIDSRVEQIKQEIERARAKYKLSLITIAETISTPEGGAAAADAERDRIARTQTAVDLLAFAYREQGKSQREAIAAAEADIAVLNKSIAAKGVAASVTKAQVDLDHAAAGNKTEATKATEAANNATTEAEKAIAKLGESFQAAGGQDSLDRRLASLSSEADKGEKVVSRLNTAIELLEDAIAKSGDDGEKSNLEKKLDALNETKEKLARWLLDIDDAQRRAIEEDRSRRQKEVDDQLKQLDAIRDETLRNLGLEVEAEKAAAKAKLRERLAAAEELRKSPNADAAGLADKQIEAARRAYDAELARIQRNQAEKEKNYATNRAAAQRAEDDAKRLALLAEAEELKAKAAEARKRGDLRTEAALRDQIAKLIQESGDRTQELLNKEKDVLKSVRERFDLAKQEVDTRLRLGEGGAGIVAGVRSGLSAIAGASDASSFRSGVRDRLGLAQTEAGAKEFFGTVKQLLEAEFAGLQQQESEARKNRNQDDVLKAQQGQRDVAEKYRILNDELSRTVREIKAQPGGKPETIRPDTIISGRDVRPDEKAPPGVRVVGPQTKDAAAVDAEARFKRGEIKIDSTTPITVTVAPSAKPLKIDDSKPLDVHVTNPAPGSQPEATKNASSPVSGPAPLGLPGPGVDVGGGGVFKAISDVIAIAALGAASPGSVGTKGDAAASGQRELDRVSRQPMTPENFARFKSLGGTRPETLPPGPLVGPPGFLAEDFVGPVRLGAIPKELPKDQLERRAAFQERQTGAVAKNKSDKESRARAEAERQIAAVRRTSSPKDAQRRIDQINKRLADQFGTPVGTGDTGTPTGAATTAPDGFVGPPAPSVPTDAPTVPGAAPVPGTGAGTSPAQDAVQKTFDAVAGATAGVAALGDKLLSAVSAAGDATLSAMTTFGGKLSDTVDQLNDVTKKVQAIEASAQLLRIEGRS